MMLMNLRKGEDTFELVKEKPDAEKEEGIEDDDDDEAPRDELYKNRSSRKTDAQ